MVIALFFLPVGRKICIVFMSLNGGRYVCSECLVNNFWAFLALLLPVGQAYKLITMKLSNCKISSQTAKRKIP